MAARCGVAVLLGASTWFGAARPVVAQDQPDDARLRPATVLLADLPRGWSDDTDAVGATFDSFPSVCGVQVPRPVAWAHSLFNDDAVGSVSSVALQLPRGTARAWLDRLTRVAKSGCSQSMEPGLEGEEPIVVRFTTMPTPAFAAQRLGLRVRGNAPFQNETVLMRKGDVLVIIGSGRIFEQPLPVIPIARNVAARLSALRIV